MIIAGTGHRPNKLGGYSDENFKKLCKFAAISLSEYKPTHVISGMALGWDTAIALASIHLQIPLTAAIPFKGQELAWPLKSQIIYEYILSKCTDIVYVCNEGYAGWKMQKRNEWMVDKSDLVLALHDGTTGGTYNCIKYANKQNKNVINLYDRFLITA